jgi:ribonuclease VapC
MVIDSSVIAAILFDEPEREQLAAAIDAAPERLLSAATLVETTMVVEGRKGRQAEGVVEAFIEDGEIDLGHDRARATGVRRISHLRQGPASGQAQSRRLLLLCPGQGHRPDDPLQG